MTPQLPTVIFWLITWNRI